MPPTNSFVPPGATCPSTLSAWTKAPRSSVRKRPAGESESDSVRPLMVCPPPLKVPLKLAMGSKSTPRREMSAVRRTVLPRDQAS